MPVAFHLGTPSGSKGNRDTITYRHLLSPGSYNHPGNPLRCIALADLDSAYAQFEMQRLGMDRSIPCAVQQWQGLIAINYAAKAFGLTRHVTPEEAKKKCPDIVLVHVSTLKDGDTEPGYHPDATYMTHKISLEYYRRESRRVLEVFTELCPVVEKASIDEAFFDFTTPVRETLLKRFPYLASVPSTGLDTPLPPAPQGAYFQDLGFLVPVEPVVEADSTSIKEEVREIKSEIQEEAKLDAAQEVKLEVKEEDDVKGKARAMQTNDLEPVTWADIGLSIGAELMQACRAEVKERLSYTCSAGVARNKSLAKLSAGFNKPDGQTILRDSAIAGFLQPIKFQKLRWLGGKLGRNVAEIFNASTFGDLWTVSLKEMQDKIGEENGMWLWEIIRGIDFSKVEESKIHVKSMISSKFFAPALDKWEESTYWLNMQSSELVVRLLEARDRCPNIWPKTLSMGYRSSFTNYKHETRQMGFPYTSNLTTEYVLKYAQRLLREFVGSRKGAGAQPDLGFCTGLNLRFQDLERLEPGQTALKSFFTGGPNGSPHKFVREESVLVKRETTVKTEDVDIKPETLTGTTVEIDFVCSKCAELVCSTVVREDTAVDFAVWEDLAIKRFKQEHEDWHLAKMMYSKSRVVVGSTQKKRKKKDPVKLEEGSQAPRKRSKRTLSGFFGSPG